MGLIEQIKQNIKMATQSPIKCRKAILAFEDSELVIDNPLVMVYDIKGKKVYQLTQRD